MSYIGNEPISAAFLTDTFSGNGSTVAFTMQVAPANTSSILVVVTGVTQDPSTYAVAGTTLTFSAAPPTGTNNISVRYLGIPASGVTTTAYRTVTDFTATAGQTTFSVPSYTVGYIDVYRSGVRLAAADYTATNGTTVVLTNSATAGDSVVTESFYVSSVLNAIPATAGAVNSTYITDGAVTTAKIDAAAVTQAKVATGVAGTGPAFSAVMASNQSVTASTTTKIAFAVEQFDTNSNYDTSTYRFTPTVAGYYKFNIALISFSTDITQLLLYKNGSGVYGAYPNTTQGLNLNAIVYANGSSDYFEAYVVTTANASIRDLDTYSYFQGFLARAA